MAANRAVLTSHAPARVRIALPRRRAEASAHARSRPACSSRHAARQTRASTRRSRRAVSICALIGGPAQRAGSPARAAPGLSARGSGTALPAPSACLPGIRGVFSSAWVARRTLTLSLGESWPNMHHADPACVRHGADPRRSKFRRRHPHLRAPGLGHQHALARPRPPGVPPPRSGPAPASAGTPDGGALISPAPT
jgi:hypothetical protein